MDFYMTINLTKLLDARIVTEEDSATNMEEEGVFIPIKKNRLYKNKFGRVYLRMFSYECTKPNIKATHAIFQALNDEDRSELSEQGFVEFHPMGTMKPITKKK